jgi:hypothetical protein
MKRLVGVCIAVAAALLALGFYSAGNWLGATVTVLIGGLWLAGLYRDWSGTAALGLLGAVAMAAMGARSAVAVPILLASVVVALIAWDLQRFLRRLGASGQVIDQSALVRAHLRWSLCAAGVGLSLGLVAPLMVVPLPFGVALLLSVLLLFGVSRAIGRLNRRA